MRGRVLIACGITTVTLVASSACGGDSKPDRSGGKTYCTPMSTAMRDIIADGLSKKATIPKGVFVPIAEARQSLGYTQLAAVQVKDTNGTMTATLATGSKTAGPIIAVDNVAQLYFTWGAAATDGSPIDQYRDRLLGSADARSASGCLG